MPQPLRSATPPVSPSNTSMAPPAPKHWLLTYTYVDGILEKRGPYRPAHLANAKLYSSTWPRLDRHQMPYPAVLHSAMGLPCLHAAGRWQDRDRRGGGGSA
ncbi:hypothetical protein HaLaN_16159 [Haematococcus lacustris]|uniref:Uncharacterized protein n=1 Tax=Haematococcus lacustris TaxID=44745 RepID=A0A699ZAR0_HAELA|nr:hypothetical protein HaLaN_16159 [Haematococcus lacustris]